MLHEHKVRYSALQALFYWMYGIETSSRYRWRVIYLLEEEEKYNGTWLGYRSARVKILEFYPAWGPLGPTQPEPEVYLQICYPHPT
jgi:hypothetical protein